MSNETIQINPTCQTLYYPESRNRAKFVREESLRADEDALDCEELVDLFAK